MVTPVGHGARRRAGSARGTAGHARRRGPGPGRHRQRNPAQPRRLSRVLPAQLLQAGHVQDHAERTSAAARSSTASNAAAATSRTSRFAATGAWPTSKPSTTPSAGSSTICSRPPRRCSTRSTTAALIPPLKQPKLEPFEVRNIFTDFKRHDLGPNFHERNYDGSIQREFMTTPLWGVGTTAPYGHDGRSINLTEVILRHGGEAQRVARRVRATVATRSRARSSTSSTRSCCFRRTTPRRISIPGDRNAAGFPQYGHGSIRLPVLFNDPTDPE